VRHRAPGWYPGPGLPGRPETAGRVLRWWDGDRWGYDVAELGSDPAFPPANRRRLADADAAATTHLAVPRTARLPVL